MWSPACFGRRQRARASAAAREHPHPFHKAIITTDAHAACIGAHGERDGGIIIAGTGTVGWAFVRGKIYRVGGWGLPLSDEGSGAWLGSEALRRVLWAWDSRAPWTPLLRTLFANFGENPHAIVGWTATATPRDFGSFAPLIVDHAVNGDLAGIELMKSAAAHIDALAERLIAGGADRLALVGGLGQSCDAGSRKPRCPILSNRMAILGRCPQPRTFCYAFAGASCLMARQDKTKRW